MENLYINTAFNKKGHEKDNQVEQADNELELYETIDVDNDILGNTSIAAIGLDISNSGLDEDYEALKTAPKEEHKTDASKTSICSTDRKQMVMLLPLVICFLMSSASLVIAFTNPWKEESTDGSWSSWEPWRTCSTTCDVGLHTRHRNCSSSAPLGQGRQCLGEAKEHQLCMSAPCSTKSVDGSWSGWTPWGACSNTCDVGLQKRHRNCLNAALLDHGRQCLGENSEQRLCMPVPCSNGGWSVWGSWGSCSTSCDIGLKSRLRTCTHPRPSLFGSFCEGANTQSEICEKEPCKETRVAFNVYQSTAKDVPNTHTVIFTTVLLNEGEAYNKTDGIFTAPFNGLYQFNGQICIQKGAEADYTLTMEGKSFASGEYMTPSDASDGKCTSFSAVVSVLKGEKVWITSHHLYAAGNDWNSFSGILIHKT